MCRYNVKHQAPWYRLQGQVEKGSICINGTSLTCFDSTDESFAAAIIPYTYEHTTFRHLRAGDLVNLEFDIVGKYVAKMLGR